MVAQKEWTGLVRGRHDAFDGLRMVLPLEPAIGSWGGPFRVAASDGNQYFVKSLDVCAPDVRPSVAAELVVAGVGRLIGAPVCVTSLLRIPAALAGWELRPGVRLQAGLAHASLALRRADEMGRPRLAARTQDDNARRHVGAYALYDWCFGSDPQWLYDLDDDRALYSHDHGLYLPPAGKGWFAKADLVATVDYAHGLSDPAAGLLRSAVDEVAERLEKVAESSWPTC